MADESHAYGSPTGSGAPDPVEAEQKPPAIRTMGGDLSNAKSGSAAKPPGVVAPADEPTPTKPPKDASVVSDTKPVRIPEPPSPPKSVPPRPPAIPKPTEVPKQGLPVPPKPTRPPQAPTHTPQSGVPVHPTPPPKPLEQKPVVPAMTASLKPIAPEHIDVDTSEEVGPEGPALAEDELLSTEETELEGAEEILDVTKKPEGEENIKPKKKAPKKALVLSLIVVVLFVVLGGGGYFAYSQGLLSFLEKKDSPSTATPTPPVQGEDEKEPISEPEPEPLPKPLIAADGTLTIAVASPEEAQSKLTQRILGKVGEGITAIYLTDAETFTQFPFTDAIAAAGIIMPNEVLATLNTENYTLFLTKENDTGAARFGFVVEISDIALIKNAMTVWEKTIADDTDQLLRTLGKDTEIEAPLFETNTRDSIDIRFVNFSGPTLSLDYAIAQDNGLLFLGTSRDNIFMALDAR